MTLLWNTSPPPPMVEISVKSQFSAFNDISRSNLLVRAKKLRFDFLYGTKSKESRYCMNCHELNDNTLLYFKLAIVKES